LQRFWGARSGTSEPNQPPRKEVNQNGTGADDHPPAGGVDGNWSAQSKHKTDNVAHINGIVREIKTACGSNRPDDYLIIDCSHMVYCSTARMLIAITIEFMD
jgi:hypothetical protein